MQEEMAKLKAWAEAEINKLHDQITDRWEAIMKAELAAWQERWPRHKFKAAQAHGLLLLLVDPPICGQTDPTNISVWDARGAIAELGRRADALSTAHAELEWKVATYESDGWISAD